MCPLTHHPLFLYSMPGAKVQLSCADAGSAQGVHKQLLKWISSVFNMIEGEL